MFKDDKEIRHLIIKESRNHITAFNNVNDSSTSLKSYVLETIVFFIFCLKNILQEIIYEKEKSLDLVYDLNCLKEELERLRHVIPSFILGQINKCILLIHDISC